MRTESAQHFLPTDTSARIVYSKTERVCALTCGAQFSVDLPSHSRGGFSPLLTAEVASHVLTPLEPRMHDVDADVHVARGFASVGEAPIVTAIWFRASIASPRVNIRDVLARLRARAITYAYAQDAYAREDSATIQGASGVYIESGLGVLAGTGRHSIIVNGQARSLPYCRNSIMSADEEALLAELMCGVAHVVEHVDPCMVRRDHVRLLERGHQYPRQRLHGDPFIASHQVVLRASGGPTDPQGSDLHLDPMDGRGDADGSWTVYAGEPPSAFDHLAVLEGSSGGIGFDVRVGGFGSEWVCAVHFDTARRLHGSVWPNVAPFHTGGDAMLTCGTPVGSGLRVVTYTLRRIELFEESVREAPGEEARAIEASTESVKRRMLGQRG